MKKKGVVIILSLAVALGCLVSSMAFGIYLWASADERAPGPYSGNENVGVMLESAAPDPSDGERIAERIRKLGPDVELQDSGESGITMEIHGVHSAASLLEEVLRPSRLAFAVETDSTAYQPAPGGALPEGVQIEVEHVGDPVESRRAYVGVRASLEPLLAAYAGIQGTRAAIECQDEAPGQRCFLRFLEEPPALTGDIVASAEVETDEGTLLPHVAIAFTEEAGTGFADLTERVVGRRVAIVVDDRVMSMPLVRERIPGGRAQITMGGAEDAVTTYNRARSLAAVLSTGPLHAQWSVSSITAIGP